MARGALPLGSVGGSLSALLIAGMVAVPLVAVIWRAGGLAPLGAADLAAIRFTLLQAALSAAVATLAAIPVARALARQRFAGRGVLIALLGMPFLLPVIVAVLGLLAVFGRTGFLNAGLQALGLPGLSIYGLQGVVLAHLFFNLPLATRMLLQGWQTIPAEHMRLAAALGFGRADTLRHLERPMLARHLPGVALTVFLLCLTSFAVALTLGGGPGASTIELAIYQSFRFEFDLARMASLALVQVALTVAAVGFAMRFDRPIGMGGGLDRVTVWQGIKGTGLQDALVLAAATLFVVLPVLTVLLQGLPEITGLSWSVWHAASLSVCVAVAAALLSVSAGLALALAALRFATLELVGMLTLTASPIVMGAGLYLMLQPMVDPTRLALPVTASVNAVLALPLVLRILLPALRGIEADFGRLADHLGLHGAARLRHLILPRLRRPLGFAAALAAALSMGDLGVIALFADPHQATLPMLVYQLMGAYRMDQAAGAAVLLTFLSLGLFVLFDQWGRHAAA